MARSPRRCASLLAAALALLSACGHRPPTITPAAAPPPRVAPSYPSFADAMDDLDPVAARPLASTPPEARCADALAAYLQGDWAVCLDALEGLRDAPAPLLARARTLREMAFLQLAQWDRPTALDDPDLRALVSVRRAAPPTSLALPPDGVALPLTFSSASIPVVTASLAGRPESLWLDTAASLTVLSSDVAARAGVTPVSGPLTGTMGDSGSGTRLTVRLGTIARLGLGPAVAGSVTTAIADQHDMQWKILFVTLMKVDGILGWNVLRDLDTTIDYPAARLLLRPPAPAAGVRNLVWMERPLALASTMSGASLHLVVDTGAARSYLTPRGAHKLGFSARPGDTLHEVSVLLTGQQITFAALPVKTLRESVEVDGLLGNDVFRQGTLRLRPSSGQLDFSVPMDHPYKPG